MTLGATKRVAAWWVWAIAKKEGHCATVTCPDKAEQHVCYLCLHICGDILCLSGRMERLPHNVVPFRAGLHHRLKSRAALR